MRHAETHLDVDVKAVIAEQRIKRAVNVYDEFEAQLQFTKYLRDTALAYLQDPEDPFKLFLGPQAHEIMIMYADFNDMEELENGKERPRKKKALLNVLLSELAGRGIEANRVEMKQVDLRKYALDAISQTDVCIDKFARMGGDYQKDRKNDKDPSVLIEKLVEFLIQRGWERSMAEAHAKKRYLTGVT